jgi:pyrimidine-nucleoside phosphorylase
MRAVDIIREKRDGLPLTTDEINFFIDGFTHGDIPDYQAAAWLMAVVWRGMDPRETADLTMAMARSGEMLDLSSVAPFVVDKHSTGGVGDKTTLVIGPLVASLGLPVGKMSGRSLGFSGGTLDKLESIPGFRIELSQAEFLAQLRDVGLVVAGPTARLAPADGKLYALRDVTATIESIPLIAGSIMSKKIAGGANAIVLDVKVGHGAFMQTEAEAYRLAEMMVEIGRSVGRQVTAVVSDMSQPLGQTVGNALEIKEAVDTLHGVGPADFTEHCLSIAAEMLLLASRASNPTEARAKLEEMLYTRVAFDKLRAMVVAQGGDPSVIDQPDRLPRASLVVEVPAPHTGYVAGINAREFGLTAVELGAGRAQKGDPIDHAVGIVVGPKIGDWVTKGETLFTLHANDSARLSAAQARLLAAYDWSDQRAAPPPLIHRIIRA